MKLLTVFIAFAMLSACMHKADLREYNDNQLKLEHNHGHSK